MGIYGEFHAAVGAVITVLLMVMMWVFGYHLLENPKVDKVTGTITGVQDHSVSTPSNGGSPTYYATGVVSYTYGSASYSATLPLVGPVPFVVGQPVLLVVDPKEPDAPSQPSGAWWVSYALFAGGLLIGTLGVGNAVMVFSNKTIAATEGAVDAVGAFSNAL